MRRMRSENSIDISRCSLAGLAQQDGVVVDAEEELAAGGAHAQIIDPGLQLRGEIVVLVAANGAGDAADSHVGVLACGQVLVDLYPGERLHELERRAPDQSGELAPDR